MLRNIGLGPLILIILTIAVVLVVLSQTTTLGPLAGHVGVSPDSALTLGQNVEPLAEATLEAMPEATEAAPAGDADMEAAEMTPEAEATDEASQ